MTYREKGLAAARGPDVPSEGTEIVAYCNFCGKMQHYVKVIIANPTGKVHICDECIDACTQIVKEHCDDGSR